MGTRNLNIEKINQPLRTSSMWIVSSRIAYWFFHHRSSSNFFHSRNVRFSRPRAIVAATCLCKRVGSLQSQAKERDLQQPVCYHGLPPVCSSAWKILLSKDKGKLFQNYAIYTLKSIQCPILFRLNSAHAACVCLPKHLRTQARTCAGMQLHVCTKINLAAHSQALG